MIQEYLYQPLICGFAKADDLNIEMRHASVVVFYSHFRGEVVIHTNLDVETRMFKSKLVKAIKVAIDYYTFIAELCNKNDGDIYKRIITSLYYINDDIEQSY